MSHRIILSLAAASAIIAMGCIATLSNLSNDAFAIAPALVARVSIAVASVGALFIEEVSIVARPYAVA